MPVDEKDLVKAGAEAAMAPIKDLLSRLLGPFADEVGGLFADPVRVFRLRRGLKLLQKVKQVLHDAGIDPKVVPLKVILPILEHASLEESEDLHADGSICLQMPLPASLRWDSTPPSPIFSRAFRRPMFCCSICSSTRWMLF